MKRFLLFGLFTLLLCSCDSDDNVHTEIPSVVLNAFQGHFPESAEAEWQKRDSLFEVDFELAQVDHSALINPEGRLVGKKKDISLNEIPATVISGLSRNFDRSDLGDPELVERNGRSYYQLELEKILFDEKIVLDENGKIITNLPYWE